MDSTVTRSLIPWCGPDPVACAGGTQATVASRPKPRRVPGVVRVPEPPEPPVPAAACPAGLALPEALALLPAELVTPGLLTVARPVPGVLPADVPELLPEHAARPGTTIAATAQAAIQR